MDIRRHWRIANWVMMGLAALVADTHAAESPPAWSPRQPANVRLVEDHEPELCAAVLTEARRWFASPNDNPPDLAVELEARSVEPLPGRAGFRGGLWRIAADLDSDGQNEIVLVTSEMFRSEDVYRSFILKSERELDAAITGLADSAEQRFPATYVKFDEQAFGPAGTWSSELKVLFQWHGKFYLSRVRKDSFAEAGLALLRLDADGGTHVTCRVGSDDPQVIAEKMRQSREIRALLKSLAAVGTSGTTYCGTSNMGLRWDRGAQDAVLRLAARPWTMQVSQPDDVSWKFLAAWSHEDHWNRREYLTLLQTLEPARRAYSRYLESAYGLDAQAARVRAAAAIEALVGSWFLVPSSFTDPQEADFPGVTQVDGIPYPDPDKLNLFGKTGLMMAAHMNRIDQVRELLARGANPNAKTVKLQECGYAVSRGSRTALMYAAENASPLVMKVLLDAGAQPEARDSEGNQPKDYLGWNPRLTDEEKHLSMSALAALAGSRANEAGFDCAHARMPAEKAICGSEALRLLDSDMARAYVQARAGDGDSLKSDQRRWITWRAGQCEARATPKEMRECLAEETAARTRYLQYLAAP